MITISSHLPRPIQLPKCFIDWVKYREDLNPNFTFVISVGNNDDENLVGWQMRNNNVSFNTDGKCYSVRILTGRLMAKNDIEAAIGFEWSHLEAIAPNVYSLPIDANEIELIDFDAKPWNALAEIDKSFENDRP